MAKKAMKINEINDTMVTALQDRIIYVDDTDDDARVNLDVDYGILKQGLTKIGKKEKVPVGEIMVVDGDDILQHSDSIEGVLVYTLRGRQHQGGEDGTQRCFAIRSEETNNMQVGTVYGRCSSCAFGQYLKGQKPLCPSTSTLYILTVVEGDLRLVQIKLKGAGYKVSNNALTSVKAKIRGKFYSNTIIIKSKEVKGKEDSEFYVWDIEQGSALDNASPELTGAIKILAKQLKEYWIGSYKNAKMRAETAEAEMGDVSDDLPEPEEMMETANEAVAEAKANEAPKPTPTTATPKSTPVEKSTTEDDLPF